MNTPHLQPYPAYKPSGVQWLGDVPVALGGGAPQRTCKNISSSD